METQMSPEKENEIKVKRVLPYNALKLNLDALKLNESSNTENSENTVKTDYKKPKKAIEYKMKMKIGSETYNSLKTANVISCARSKQDKLSS